jgi:hypothetical protein
MQHRIFLVLAGCAVARGWWGEGSAEEQEKELDQPQKEELFFHKIFGRHWGWSRRRGCAWGKCWGWGKRRGWGSSWSKAAWDQAFVDQGLVPGRLSEVPQYELMMYWPRSGVKVRPNSKLDTGWMLTRPTLRWPYRRGALYTVMMLDEGVDSLNGSQYIHWLVENVPGNKVRLD